MPCEGDCKAGRLFGTMVVAGLVEVAWVVTTSAILFTALSKAKLFRVSKEDEEKGSDLSKHGGRAYSMTPQAAEAARAAAAMYPEANGKSTASAA